MKKHLSQGWKNARFYTTHPFCKDTMVMVFVLKFRNDCLCQSVCVCVSSILLIPQVSLSLCQERIWAEQTPHINEVIVEVPSAECCFKYWHRATWPCVLWQPINTARYVGMRGHYYSTCSSVGGCMWGKVERVRGEVRDRHSFSDLPWEVSLFRREEPQRRQHHTHTS